MQYRQPGNAGNRVSGLDDSHLATTAGGNATLNGCGSLIFSFVIEETTNLLSRRKVASQLVSRRPMTVP